MLKAERLNQRNAPMSIKPDDCMNENNLPSSTSRENEERKQRVARRWKMLRQALTKQSIEKTDAFAGYGLLEPPKIHLAGPDTLKNLQAVGTSGKHDETSVDDIASAVLGTMALDPKCRRIIVPSSVLPSTCSEERAKRCSELISRCDLVTCNLSEVINNDDGPPSVQLELTPKSNVAHYRVNEYRVGKVGILVRERVKLQVSLDELATHHQHTIDNTGNIRIWDCEKTLAWALNQMLAVALISCNVVVELGAGMAGLAALSLCHKAQKVYITDGHIGSIYNNRTNVALMRAAGMLGGNNTNNCQAKVECQILKWSTDMNVLDAPADEADLTIVSDCTHFQEFHGELLWTLLQCTAVGGNIVMCHPNRGQSLDNFLDLIEAVCCSKSSSTDEFQQRLIATETWTNEILEQKHDLAAEDEHYDANIHRPRIFVIKKERQATEEDRQLVLNHIRSRTTS